MTTDIPMLRRLMLALTGVAVGAYLLRAQVADALVVRGDECLYRRELAAALRYYQRAATIDVNDATAVDRLAFVALLARDRESLQRAIEVATRYLRSHPGDDAVRMDRAMAERATQRRAEALRDFAVVGLRATDGRALTFAGYEALALGWRAEAVAFWRRALAQAPSLPAPRHALSREGFR